MRPYIQPFIMHYVIQCICFLNPHTVQWNLFMSVLINIECHSFLLTSYQWLSLKVSFKQRWWGWVWCQMVPLYCFTLLGLISEAIEIQVVLETLVKIYYPMIWKLIDIFQYGFLSYKECHWILWYVNRLVLLTKTKHLYAF